MSIVTIEQIFNAELKPPYFYSLTFNDVHSPKDLFNKFFEFYKFGSVILFGNINNNTISLDGLTENRRLLLKQYMMSFGIHPIITEYNRNDIDYYYRKIETEFSEIKNDKDEKVIVKAKKNDNGLYYRISLCVSKDRNVLLQVYDLMKNNSAYQDLLDIPLKMNEVKDYKVKVQTENIVYVLRFDFL